MILLLEIKLLSMELCSCSFPTTIMIVGPPLQTDKTELIGTITHNMIASIYFLNWYPTIGAFSKLSKMLIEVVITGTRMDCHHAVLAEGSPAFSALRGVDVHIYDSLLALLGWAESDIRIIHGLSPKLYLAKPALHCFVQELINGWVNSQFGWTILRWTQHFLPAVDLEDWVFDHTILAILMLALANRDHFIGEEFLITNFTCFSVERSLEGFGEALSQI